jgi:AcrR family transcriptional regulator
VENLSARSDRQVCSATLPTVAEGTEQHGARERLLRTAYDLFHRHTVNTVGVDRIVEEANVAKTTLYRHFPSKEDLAVSVLHLHQDVWLTDWLEQAIARSAGTAGDRLLAVFDAFDEWFRRDEYQGCLFARALLETRDPASPIREAAVTGLQNIRALILGLAEEAGVRDPAVFALQTQLLLLGATVAAVAGELDAAQRAQEVARAMLELEGARLSS